MNTPATAPLARLVSLFPDVRRTAPTSAPSLRDVLGRIASGEYAARVAAVRRAIDDADDAAAAKRDASARKRSLPAVTFGGTFTRRETGALATASGIICLDFDGLPPDLDAADARRAVSADARTLAAFVSPSGRGVKVLAYTNDPAPSSPADAADWHKATYRALAADYAARYGLAPDDGACDLARLCFVSDDPDLYVNEDAEPVRTRPATVQPATVRPGPPSPAAPPVPGTRAPLRAPAPHRASFPSGAEPWTEDEVRAMLRAIPGRPAYPDWVRLISATRGAVEGDAATAERLLCERWPEEVPGEYARKLREGPDRVTRGTLLAIAIEHGYTSTHRRSAAPPPPVRSARGGDERRPPRVDDDDAAEDDDADTGADALAFQPFPVDLLPPCLANFARAHAHAGGFDAGAVAVPMLAIVAGAIANTAEARVAWNWAEPSILWSVLVAPSGSRKSAALDAAAGPLFAIEHRAHLDANASAEAYAEAMRAHRDAPKGKRGREPERPRPRRYRVGVTTIESLAIVHADNPRGLTLIADELSGFFGGLGRYSKTGAGADVARFIEAHGNKPIRVDRASDAERPTLYIERPSVSITGTIQPGVFAGVLRAAGAIDSGLAARFLPISPPSRAPRPVLRADGLPATIAGPERGAVDAYARAVAALYDVPVRTDDDGRVCPYAVPLSDDARRLLAAFEGENADRVDALGEDSPLRPFVAKATGTAVRLALVLQLAAESEAGRFVDRDALAIGAHAMRSGLARALYFIREAVRLYVRAGVDEATQTPDEALAARLPDTFGPDDVKCAGKLRGKAHFAVIRRLVAAGLAEQTGRGRYRRTERPSEVTRLLASLATADDAPPAPTTTAHPVEPPPLPMPAPPSPVLPAGGDGAPLPVLPPRAVPLPSRAPLPVRPHGATTTATEAPGQDGHDPYPED